MVWRVETLNDAADRESDALPADIRARFARTCQLIATIGLEQIGTPHVSHLITGNAKDIAGGELIFDAIRIVTPSAWLKEDD